MNYYTDKQAVTLAIDLDCSLRFDGDNYRVNVKGGNEDTAYYTDSQNDALSQCEEWANEIDAAA